MEKYRRAGQASNDYNTAHALFVLDNQGYRHILEICNTAFPLQHRLHERALVLRYTYIAGLPITQFLKSNIIYI